jgi:hypothetical protein
MKDPKAEAEVLPHAIDVPVSPELICIDSIPVVGVEYPVSTSSVYAGEDLGVIVAGLVPLKTAPIKACPVSAALFRTGVGVPPED